MDKNNATDSGKDEQIPFHSSTENQSNIEADDNPQSEKKSPEIEKRDLFKWLGSKNIREWVLIFVTIVLVIFTGWMAFETRKLAVQTSKSVALSDSSIYIAKKALSLSEQNYQIDNRAWIGITSVPVFMEGEGTIIQGTVSNGWNFQISITNYGKTPADSVLIGSSTCFSLTRPKVFFRTPIIIPPTKSESINIFINNFSIAVLKNINQGNKKLYFYGIIIYKDIYNEIDTTEFMYRFNPDENGHYMFEQIGINRMK